MNIEEKLWGLANGITTFAVAQAIAFLVAIGANPSFSKALVGGEEVITIAILVATSIYIAAVLLIGFWLVRDSDHRKVWIATTLGRAVAIAAINGFAAYVVSSGLAASAAATPQ